jgi:hypothetical protein
MCLDFSTIDEPIDDNAIDNDTASEPSADANQGYPEDRYIICATCDAAGQRLYKQKRRAAAQAAAESQEGAA